MNDLIPRSPKRKRQPTADCMREQLAMAADRIIELQTRIDRYRFADMIIHGDHPPPPAPAPPPCRSITAYPPGHSLWRRIFRK